MPREMMGLFSVRQKLRLSPTCRRAQTISSEGMSTCGLYLLSFYPLDIKAHGSEPIITTYHCAVGVFHPSVVEIPLSSCKGFYKLAHRFPCLWTKSLGTMSVDAHPRLAFTYLAGVLNGIFVFCHQVGILHLTDGGYLYLHVPDFMLCLTNIQAMPRSSISKMSVEPPGMPGCENLPYPISAGI